MSGKLSPKVSSISGALALVCLFGTLSLSWTAFDAKTEDNSTQSICYAKQILLDLAPPSNQSLRSRILASLRNNPLFHCPAQPLHLPAFPPCSSLHPSIVELLPPQSLAVFHPTTRSPPA